MGEPLTMTHERMERIKEVQRMFGDFETLDLLKEVEALSAALAAAEAKLTAASKAAINMMNRHRDVVLSLEAKLADYEGTDGRCPAGHNKRFTYDLSDLGGKVGCVACERDELEAKLADERKHADELAVALGSVKWVQPMYNGSPSCSWCGNQEHLHKVECGLDKLVAAHAARRAARDGQEGTR